MGITVAELTARLAMDATQFQSGLAKAQQDADTFAGNASKKMSAAGDAMTSAGKKMTLGLTLPIAGAGAAAIKMAGDFEQSLSVLQAVSGATGAEMAQISQRAKDLGADIALPGASAKDAAEAMTELAKGGLSVAESMEAARGVLQLSAAAGIGNAEAATIAVNALSAFNLKATDMVRVNDLLAGASNATSAEITDVAQAFAQAGSSFASAKQPIESLTTGIGLLANQGIKGSDAGTSLKTMLAALTPTSDKAAGAMADLGLNAFKADGSIKDMRQIIEEVQPALRRMTDEQRMATLETAFGSDAVRAANIVLGGGVKAWDDMRTAVTRSGQAAEVAASKNGGVKGSLDALKSSVETMAITFGTKMAPVISDLAKKASDLVGVFASLPGPVQQAIIVGAGILAVIGPMVTAIGALSKVLGFLAANPVVLIIAALAALVVGLVYAYKNCEEFRDIVNGAVAAVANFVQPIIAAIAAFIGQKFEEIKAFAMTIWPQIQEAITHVVNVVEGIIRTTIDVVSALWRAWGDDLFRMVGTVWNGIKETIDNALQVIKGVIQTVVALINGDWGKAWEGIKNVVGAVWDQIGNIVSTAIGLLKSAIAGLASTIGQMALGLWDPIRDAFKGVINWIIDKWNGLDFRLPSFEGLKIAGQTVIPGFTGPTLGMPDIPKLAAGGITTGTVPFPAILHPNEVVAPLDDLPKYMPGGGGDTYITIDLSTFVGSKSELIDALHEGLLAKQRNGGNLGFRAN